MHFSKLTDPDPKNLPSEFSFRKEKNWMQLERKIDQPRKIKTYAWLSAACLLILSGFGIWQSMQEPETKLVTTVSPIVKPEIQTTAIPVKVLPKENASIQKTALVTKTERATKATVDNISQTQNPEPAITEPTSNAETVVSIPEPAKAPVQRFRVVHINELNPAVNISIASRKKAENPIAFYEPTIAEINDIQSPVKTKSMFGLLRTNQ